MAKLRHNMVGWFEIPVINMRRAIKFYESLFKIKMQKERVSKLDMAWFPWEDKLPGSPGGLIKHPVYKPSLTRGVLIYFSSMVGDLRQELSRVKKSGGKIIMPRKLISPDIGYMAIIKDSEGNKIALHSNK